MSQGQTDENKKPGPPFTGLGDVTIDTITVVAGEGRTKIKAKKGMAFYELSVPGDQSSVYHVNNCIKNVITCAEIDGHYPIISHGNIEQSACAVPAPPLQAT